MENQDSPAPVTTASPRGGWIVSPWFDLLFFANLAWPIALWPGLGSDPVNPLSFWQVYFLTTPHRWITLLLVATDPDRRDGRGTTFVFLAAIAVAIVAGSYLLSGWLFSSGTLLCLALVDTVWNAWHFGSQHAGILRMYGRLGGSRFPVSEKHITRLFVTYVSLRVPGWVTGFIRTSPETNLILLVTDSIALISGIVLVGVQFLRADRSRVGKIAYTLSMVTVYSGLLLAVRAEHTPLVIGFALASAIFHATEYLALITHYANRRARTGSQSAFRTMAGRWLTVLAVFIVGLGIFEVTAGTALGDWWVGANLTAAFLHYTYDGMIWKLRKPATAASLGVS